METRVNRYSNVAKKTSRRSMVVVASMAALFTVSGAAFAGQTNLEDLKTAEEPAVITALKKNFDDLKGKLNTTSQALQDEKHKHAEDIANGNNYRANVQKALNDYKSGDATADQAIAAADKAQNWVVDTKDNAGVNEAADHEKQA